MNIENCTLEINFKAGVIYVHAPDGHTALRICGCPSCPKPFRAETDKLFDITLKNQKLDPNTFNWGKNQDDPCKECVHDGKSSCADYPCRGCPHEFHQINKET